MIITLILIEIKTLIYFLNLNKLQQNFEDSKLRLHIYKDVEALNLC